MRYNPALEPPRDARFALDEAERIAQVTEYHLRSRIAVPNMRAHAAMHVAVENQALMGDETPVAAAMARLIGEGLNRHDAFTLSQASCPASCSTL